MKICKKLKMPSYILGLFFLTFDVLYVYLSWFNYTFAPNNALVYDLLTTVIIIWVTVREIRNKAQKTKVANIFYALLPLFASFYIFFCSRIIERGNAHIFIIHSIVSIVCSLILFFLFVRGKVIRTGFGILNIVLFLTILCFSFIASMMTGFGRDTVQSSQMSPNSLYFAEVTSSNQGALGGNTFVTITRQNRIVNLVIGKLKKKIYSGSWGEFETMILRWETDKILYINENRYVIRIP